MPIAVPIVTFLAAICLTAPGIGLTLVSKPAGSGVVNVTIAAPDGVPATVGLDGKVDYFVAKPKSGLTVSASVQAAAGSYHVIAKQMVIDGTLYLPSVSREELTVTAGRAVTVKVTYQPDDSIRDVHATALDQTSVRLTWTSKPTIRVRVRRTTGPVAANEPDAGVAVPVANGSAIDTGLSAGATYSYAVFAERDDVMSDDVGPISVRLTTASNDPTQATYVLAPGTLLLTASQIVSETPTGNGVRLQVVAGLPVPLIGSAIVLPVSPTLAGGYLGLVVAVSLDGRTIDLIAGGISDAFDYYDLSVANVQGGVQSAAPLAQAIASSASSVTPTGPVSPADRVAAAAALNSANSSPVLKAAATAASASPIDCSGGGVTGDVTFSPSLSISGHFNATITKYPFLGKQIPAGATIDTSFAVTASAPASVKTTGSFKCALDLPEVFATIAAAPVPLAVDLSPTAEFSVDGAVEIDNLGVAVTGGFQLNGSLGLFNTSSFTGGPILSAVPDAPKVVASGTVGAKLGGKIIIGPGAGTTGTAGVIAGIGGEIDPLEASFGAVFPIGDPRFNACLQATADLNLALTVSAKAWIGTWSTESTITVDGLTKKFDYPGSPWYFPSGCKDAVSPGSTLLGPGVTQVSESVTGGQNQYGHLSGLAPGTDTWVLSTGDIAAVKGVPSDFASTALGGPGDADLTALSGEPTFDAVAYNVTLVPTGSTLHVRYVFASEEYPEFVGSIFNDVMAIFVNGSNCALVPGTSTPVSVNTVNMNLNSQYYVDNSTGAAGYSTSMDGLTVPLQCDVPVTPGQPVTVKITIADASDMIYDSAIALLDKGIWSD
jgi:hypothetical protein